jgi:hypothetical protein
MIRHNRITGKQCEIFLGIKKNMEDKSNSTLPKRLMFVVTDEDLHRLKSYKHFLEWSLFNVDRALELFDSKEE